MSMSRVTGIFSTLRTRAGCNSPWRRSTQPTVRDRISPYTMSPPRALRSRCVVRGSFGTVVAHGGTTGPALAESAARPSYSIVYVHGGPWPWHVVLDNGNAVRCFDRHLDAELYIERQERLWGEWGWTE